MCKLYPYSVNWVTVYSLIFANMFSNSPLPLATWLYFSLIHCKDQTIHSPNMYLSVHSVVPRPRTGLYIVKWVLIFLLQVKLYTAVCVCFSVHSVILYCKYSLVCPILALLPSHFCYYRPIENMSEHAVWSIKGNPWVYRWCRGDCCTLLLCNVMCMHSVLHGKLQWNNLLKYTSEVWLHLLNILSM